MCAQTLSNFRTKYIESRTDRSSEKRTWNDQTCMYDHKSILPLTASCLVYADHRLLPFLIGFLVYCHLRCFLDVNLVTYVFYYMRIQKRVTVRNAMSAAEDVSSVLLRAVTPGGERVIMRADKVSQVLQKDTSAELSQQLVTCPSPDGGVAVSFKLPDLGTSET